MGTEYGHANPGDLFFGGMTFKDGMGMNVPPTGTMMSGKDIRSEVGVAGLMIPLSKQVNDRLTVGGSLDFIAAMMDLRMDMDGRQFGNLMMRNGGSIGGSMAGATGLGGMLPGVLGAGGDFNWGRFDFSDKNASTGEAKAYGWGAKLGFTYKLTDDLTIGGNYRSKTNLSDMTTNHGTMTMNITPAGGAAPMDVAMKGKVTVVDFQWPQSIGLGLAYQASDRLLLTGDVKHIGWADVMKNFHMKFRAKTGPFAGQTLDMKMDQKWRDQTAVSLGAEFKVTPDFSLRGGVNLASNPVPNKYVNPLFPAIIENHVTAGFGYNLTKNDNIGFSMTYAPEVKVKGSGPLNNGVKISHSQLNWSLGYSHSW
jgi:long-chain fatty acid transport protein